jgi:HEAT repeat protein/beta-lactamase regulating signal transducer with metallopeptidase domain
MIVFALLSELFVKSTLVLFAGWIVQMMLRRRSAASRHAAISACFVALLALPVASWLTPPLRIPPRALGMPVGEVPRHRAPRVIATGRPALDVTPSQVIASRASTTEVPAAVVPTAATSGWMTVLRASWREMLVVTWLAGVLVVLLRTAVNFAAAARLVRETESPADPAWRTMTRRAAADLGLERNVEVCVTPRVTVPLALGVFAPVLLVPVEASDWSGDRRRVVLLHELAHVKRRDCLTQAIARLACAIYWFNPMAWRLASRQLAERERACDDLVLTAGTDAAEYANHLLAIARAFKASRVPSWATVAMARPSQLEGRLLAILDPSRHRLGVHAGLSAAAAFMALVTLVPLAALELEPAPARALREPAVGAVEAAQHPVPHRAVPHVPASISPPPTVPRSSLVPSVPAPAPVPHDPVEPPSEPSSPATERHLIDALVSALGDDDREVRVQAAEALADLSDPRAAGGLTVALKDADPEVRRTAVGGLTNLDLSVSRGPLLLALADTDAGVRAAAIAGLGELRDQRHLDVFVSLLADPTAPVRSQAARALGETRASPAVEPLVAALKDPDADVRRQAAHALGEIRDARAVTGLVAALKDADADVREQAAHALGEIRASSAVPGLVEAIGDADAGVRRQIVHALAELRDARATHALVQALADRDVEVVELAAHALAELEAAAAVSALTSLLSHANSNVREQAAFALGEIGDARAVEALTSLLRDADAGVRRAAAAALGDLADEIEEADESRER